MGLHSLRKVLCVLIAGYLLMPAMAVASTAYATITGQNQGDIQGSVTEAGKEGTIRVLGFGHDLHIPLDPLSGDPTGKRIHGPLRIIKPLDRATPKLYQALVTGEQLTHVRIRFYRTGPAGSEEQHYTVLVEDAQITSITPAYVTADPDPVSDREVVSLVYRNITWTWELDGIEASDSWIAPK